MNTFKAFISIGVAIAACTTAFAAAAQAVAGPAGAGSSLGAQTSAAEMTEGEIRKVDKESKKITIKHGEIKNLDMPGMTMLFQVKDLTLLDKVKAGDKVKFRAEKAGGAIVVTDIQKQ